MERVDAEFLELLHFSKTKTAKNKKGDSENYNISPLSLALEEGNARCVETILNHMSKIPYNASSKFFREMP